MYNRGVVAIFRPPPLFCTFNKMYNKGGGSFLDVQNALYISCVQFKFHCFKSICRFHVRLDVEFSFQFMCQFNVEFNFV